MEKLVAKNLMVPIGVYPSASKSAKELEEERDRFFVGNEKEKTWMEKLVLRFQSPRKR